jgi:uncharacterized protein YbbK (DUF523 family)
MNDSKNKPIVLVSSCLEFDHVRYNGQMIPSGIVRDLMDHAELLKVCPEVGIGLGVPREPIRFVNQDGKLRLIQHKTNRDVTDDMEKFSEEFILSLGDVDGFIFKSKSPSMGVANIKVYSGMVNAPVINRCGGFFSSKIAQKFPDYPIEEDDRLRNRKIRDHFLTRLFLFFRYRTALGQNRLEEFHRQNSLLFSFYDADRSRMLDVSDRGYFDLLRSICRIPPPPTKIAAFFRELIGDQHNLVRKYEMNKIGFETLRETSRLIVSPDLSAQTFFNPYPIELAPDAEDDRNREYWKS